jgi:hypothetical protein
MDLGCTLAHRREAKVPGQSRALIHVKAAAIVGNSQTNLTRVKA